MTTLDRYVPTATRPARVSRYGWPTHRAKRKRASHRAYQAGRRTLTTYKEATSR